MNVLNKWSGAEKEMRELPSCDLDLSVARGAAYYGHARRGRGFRIRGGTAHSYYIGIESSMPSVPGIPTPMKALCIVPFGQEEGTELDIRQREFGLVVGEPVVKFHLFASNLRKKEEAGEVIEDWSGEIEEITTMETELASTGGEESGNVIPVWLQIKLTEIGTLELWCVSSEDESQAVGSWNLTFVRRDEKEE